MQIRSVIPLLVSLAINSGARAAEMDTEFCESFLRERMLPMLTLPTVPDPMPKPEIAPLSEKYAPVAPKHFADLKAERITPEEFVERMRDLEVSFKYFYMSQGTDWRAPEELVALSSSRVLSARKTVAGDFEVEFQNDSNHIFSIPLSRVEIETATNRPYPTAERLSRVHQKLKQAAATGQGVGYKEMQFNPTRIENVYVRVLSHTGATGSGSAALVEPRLGERRQSVEQLISARYIEPDSMVLFPIKARALSEGEQSRLERLRKTAETRENVSLLYHTPHAGIQAAYGKVENIHVDVDGEYRVTVVGEEGSSSTHNMLLAEIIPSSIREPAPALGPEQRREVAKALQNAARQGGYAVSFVKTSHNGRPGVRQGRLLDVIKTPEKEIVLKFQDDRAVDLELQPFTGLDLAYLNLFPVTEIPLSETLQKRRERLKLAQANNEILVIYRRYNDGTVYKTEKALIEGIEVGSNGHNRVKLKWLTGQGQKHDFVDLRFLPEGSTEFEPGPLSHDENEF